MLCTQCICVKRPGASHSPLQVNQVEGITVYLFFFCAAEELSTLGELLEKERQKAGEVS